jgi:hypothetical protein
MARHPVLPVNVIASEAKQSSFVGTRKMDCFVASAPRNDGARVSIQISKQQIHVRILAAAGARGLRVVVPQTGGSRECRMHAAPAVSCAKLCKECAHEHTGQRRQSDIPCAMALRLIPRSPRSIGLSCLRRLPETGTSARSGFPHLRKDLTPTTEASGPHGFAVRFGIVRPARRCPLTENRPANTLHARHRRVHRIPSQRSVTMANAPSSGTGWRES